MAESTREQKAFTWKSGYKEAVEPRFEAWAETAPEGKKAFQDYILFLQTKADSAGAQGELATRIEALGIAPLVDMHKRRAEADLRMLEQIADILEDSKAKAEAEVQNLLTALQKTADTATATTADLRLEKKTLETKLEETANALATAKAETAEATEKILKLEEEIKGYQARIASLEAQIEKTEAKAESLETALTTAKAEALNAQKDLLAAKEAITKFEADHNKAMSDLSNEIARLSNQLEAVRANAELADKEAQNRIGQLETATKTARLEAETAKAELAKKADQLQEARIEMASLKATIAESEKTSATLKESLRLFCASPHASVQHEKNQAAARQGKAAP